MNDKELHVVFGAGQVGSPLALALQAGGLRVRVARRSTRPVGQGIEVVVGDAREPAFAKTASAGAAVIYHCMNPSAYTAKAWREEFPALGEALIGAALANDARLVCLDNFYGYGPHAERITEETPMSPRGVKGEVRARWAQRLERARREQGLRYAVGRAGDYFGPGVEEAHVSQEVVAAMKSGTRPWAIGEPSATHAYSYLPDVVAGLVALGTAEADVEGSVFHLPVIEVSPEELLTRIAQGLGVSVRPRRGSPLLVNAMSIFVPFMHELKETLYQWDRPFLFDDSRIKARFPSLGTSLDRAVQETVQATQ